MRISVQKKLDLVVWYAIFITGTKKLRKKNRRENWRLRVISFEIFKISSNPKVKCTVHKVIKRNTESFSKMKVRNYSLYNPSYHSKDFQSQSRIHGMLKDWIDEREVILNRLNQNEFNSLVLWWSYDEEWNRINLIVRHCH